jgi:regulator of sigma E protease
MTIILFLVVLAILIFVHELGHFMVAKKSGIRVDEFAIGFPPKIFGWVRGETKYILNLIPFGGYVKIFGENPDNESMTGVDSKRSFVNAKKWKQVCVLLAGIGMNIIFAWILISISFMFGSLVPVGESASNYSKYIKDSSVILTGIAPDSAAEKAGLKTGDKLITVSAVTGTDLNTTKIRALIEQATSTVAITYQRSGEVKETTATPTSASEPANNLIVSTSTVTTNYIVQAGDTLNIIATKFGFFNYKMAGIISVPSGNLDLIRPGDIIIIETTNTNPVPVKTVENIGKKVIGIYMENVGVVQLNPILALWEGGKLTVTTFGQVAAGLGTFLWQAIRGQGDFSQVSGPVGIVGMVGDAASFGFAYLLGFVAFISLNLAVINLIPFPALDGGRVFFIIIETITRRKIKPQIANTVNTVGFFILISLMLVITYRDIMKFF